MPVSYHFKDVTDSLPLLMSEYSDCLIPHTHTHTPCSGQTKQETLTSASSQ